VADHLGNICGGFLYPLNKIPPCWSRREEEEDLNEKEELLSIFILLFDCYRMLTEV